MTAPSLFPPTALWVAADKNRSEKLVTAPSSPLSGSRHPSPQSTIAKGRQPLVRASKSTGSGARCRVTAGSAPVGIDESSTEVPTTPRRPPSRHRPSRRDLTSAKAGLHDNACVTEDGPPPAAAKTGFIWKWQSDGSWFERRISLGRFPRRRSSKRDKRRHVADLRTSLEDQVDSPNGSSLAVNESSSALVTDEASPLPSYHQQKRPRKTLDDPSEPRKNKRAGFYKRSKQRLVQMSLGGGSPHSSGTGSGAESLANQSDTQDRLDQASHWLRVLLENEGEGKRGGRSQTHHEEGIILTRTKHRLFRQRDSSIMSRSSSILHLMMGDPPSSSPTQDSMYTGNDQKEYQKVDIAAPEGPTFLPSEATRLGTPPLPSEKNPKGGQRGYFFDLHAPSEGDSSLEVEAFPFADPGEQRPGHISRVPTLTRWYGVRLDDDDEQMDAADVFEPDVPVHLPNSPLCPANILHPSRGRGECIFHGRNRALTPSP